MNQTKQYVEWPYRAGNGYRISRFPGICKWCGTRYYAGDKVNWNPRVKGTCCHAGCYAAYGSPTPTIQDYTNSPEPLDIRPNPVVDVDTPEVTPTPEVEHVVSVPSNAPTNGSLGDTIAEAIAPYLEGRLKGMVTREQVEDIVEPIAQEVFKSLLDKALVKTVTQIEVTKWDGNSFEVTDLGLQHKSFKDLLQILSAKQSNGYRLNVWLVGPAGTGKTTAAENCAKALGLNFYFTGSIDTEYKLTGFVDAQGRVINTAFRTAYQNGGLFLFDECDSSLPAALLAFNAALANGAAAFPDAIVPRHPDFVCVAAANTFGLGATNDYVGRLKLDAAFLDRFVQLYWDTDEGLELATSGNGDWTKIVQGYRARAKAKGIKVIISPRASYFGSALLATGMSMDMVKAVTIRKAMTEDQWASIQ